jgi:hypothetical protein
MGHRHRGVDARWLRRCLEEHEQTTIDDAVWIAAAHGGLRGRDSDRAARLLREVAAPKRSRTILGDSGHCPVDLRDSVLPEVPVRLREIERRANSNGTKDFGWLC